MKIYGADKVGCRIVELRVKAGMTREKLSEAAEISPKFLYEIETGKKSLSVNSLCKICNALHTNSDSLLAN